MPTARLTDRAVLAVTGAEAAPFLQGLVTNDVAKLNPGSSTYAALLTPQGKIVTDFLIHRTDDGFRLDVAATQAADLLKRLTLYRLRAPVGLEDVSATQAVFAAWGEVAATPADPRFHALGARWIAAPDSLTPDADLADYQIHRLALGVPDSADTANQFALDANLEELHGLDFKKGCYVGQEVTARMKHKASPRRRLAPVVTEGDLPPPGTRIVNGSGADAGDLASGFGAHAIASIKLAGLDPLIESQLFLADGRKLSISAPAYPLPPLAVVLTKT